MNEQQKFLKLLKNKESLLEKDSEAFDLFLNFSVITYAHVFSH